MCINRCTSLLQNSLQYCETLSDEVWTCWERKAMMKYLHVKCTTPQFINSREKMATQVHEPFWKCLAIFPSRRSWRIVRWCTYRHVMKSYMYRCIIRYEFRTSQIHAVYTHVLAFTLLKRTCRWPGVGETGNGNALYTTSSLFIIAFEEEQDGEAETNIRGRQEDKRQRGGREGERRYLNLMLIEKLDLKVHKSSVLHRCYVTYTTMNQQCLAKSFQYIHENKNWASL